MITYQDFLAAENRAKWIAGAISTYMRSGAYQTALDADEYEAQRNISIRQFVKKVYDITGKAVADPTASNYRIASNFFHHLVKARVQYSLGNGVSFPSVQQKDGTMIDMTKETLGKDFDTRLTQMAKLAVRHGASYMFVDEDRYIVMPMTEFLPLKDEETGIIRAGIQFWSLGWRRRPINVVLFEEDGYTKYRTESGKYSLGSLQEIQP